MKRITLSVLLCLLISSISFAASKPNYYSTAKQHEANGNLGSAANDYANAAGQTDSLARRAEIYTDSVRVFLKSNNYRGAVEQMLQVKHNDPKRVISLLAKYEPQARTALLSSVNNNRSFGFPHEGMRNEEISLFHQFFPKSKVALAEDFYKKGVSEKGTDGEGFWFDLAAEASDKVAQKVVAYYMGNADKLSIEQQVPYLTKAGKYIQDFKVRQAKADQLLPLGKELAKKPREEARTSAIREALVVLMGQSWVQEKLPEVVVYDTGRHKFTLNAGEQSEFYIAYPYGRRTNSRVYWKKGSEFVSVYENGDVVAKDQPYNGNLSKFKFRATTDTYIEMVVE